MAETRFRCQAACLERGEAMLGTASRVRRWIFVEQSGPWGATAIRQSRLEASVATRLEGVAREVGARVILIRRHGRYVQRGHHVYVASTREREPWVEAFTLASPEEILSIDFEPLRESRSVGGAPVSGPLFFVCTHGKHDACCAQYGRPVAAALEAHAPGESWECSHIGGDRFAANLLALPHGLYFGHVTPLVAPRLVDGYRAGRIALDHYRGRAAHPFVIQAAEGFLRRARGFDGVDDLRLLRSAKANHRAEAWFVDRDGRRHHVVVDVARSAPARLTCGATAPSAAPRFELVAID